MARWGVSQQRGDREDVIAQTHLGRSSTGDDVRVLNRPLDNHDRVVQRALDLGDELVCSTTENHRAGLGGVALLKQVEPLASNLSLLEPTASTEVLGLNVGARALDRASDGLDDTLEVVGSDATGTEDVSVGEVLSCEVTDRELGEDDLGARGNDGLKLLVDDGPLGIDNGLVLLKDASGGWLVASRAANQQSGVSTDRDLRDPNLGVVLLGLEFELDVEAEYPRVLEALGLLLETGVRERLLERDTLDEEGVLRRCKQSRSAPLSLGSKTPTAPRTCIPPPGTFLVPIRFSSRSSWSRHRTASTTICEKKGFCEWMSLDDMEVAARRWRCFLKTLGEQRGARER